MQHAHADDIEYAYDEAGRLVQASNRTSGEAVRYTYDAAGNITSQISGSISTLAIGHFSPRRGPVGTNVTINGTGFSPTPAGNTVRFNGVPATVVSATQTRLVAVVPASASSGAVSVEVAAASVTSSETFVVTAVGDGPSISVVLPTVSAAGNLATIVGANFEPVTTSNHVRLNNVPADVLAATQTTITFRVPAEAGSGKIKVTTPRGVAVSPTEFIVLPPGYGAPALTSIDRVSADGTSTVSITAANNYGARLFEGKAGELLTIGLVDTTVASAEVRVVAPDNTVIASGTVKPAQPGLQVPKLKLTGTHTIYVFPSAVGSVTVGVFKPTIASLTLGTPAPVSITMPGRRASVIFAVPADTYADVTLSAVNLAGTFSLIAPDGSVLKSQVLSASGLSFQPLLKQAGQYTLLFDPNGSVTGSLTASVSQSAANSLSRNTTREFDINSATPATFTFRGEAGEYISLATVLAAPTAFALSVQVKTPEGVNLGSRSVGTSYADLGLQRGSMVFNLDPLPIGGTYTVTVTRTSGTSSNVRMTPTAATTAVAPLPADGTTRAVAITVPGQSVIHTFSGDRGQFLSLAVSEQENFLRGATATVFTPDGAVLLTQSFTIRRGGGVGTPGGGGTGDPYRHGTAVVNMGPLPMGGTYRVLLQQADMERKEDAYTGQWLLTLSTPVTGTLAINRTDHKRMEINGQGVLYSFDGVAGTPLALGVQTDLGHPSNPNTMNDMAISVFDPDGIPVATGRMTVAQTQTFASAVVNLGPLAVSGRYRVFLQQLGYTPVSTGGVDVALSLPVQSPMNGTSVPVELIGQGAMGTFTATVGEYRTVRAESSGYISGSRIRVLAPDGSEVGKVALSYSSQYNGYNLLNVGPLRTSGSYLVLVEQTGSNTQNIGALTVDLMAPVSGGLSAGSPTEVTVPRPGQSVQYTFAAEQGSYRSLLVSETAGPVISADVAILDPSGVSVASAGLNGNKAPTHSGRVLLNAGPLPVTGNYSVLIQQTNRERQWVAESTYMVTLASPVESASENIQVGLTGQGMMRTFVGSAGQNVSLQVSENGGQITHTKIGLLAPNGTVLRSGVMNAARCTGTTCAGYTGSTTLTSAQLPVAGTYRALVQQTALADDASGTGTLNITIHSGTAAPGSTTNVATTTAGQYATTTYVAAAGQSFSVALTSAAQSPTSATAYSIYVLRSGGAQEAATNCTTAAAGCELAVRDVAESGTYQIQVRPASNATISGVLTVAPAVTGELALDTPSSVALSAVGQTGYFSFATTTKKSLSLSLESVSTVPANTLMYATVYTASGSGVGSELSTLTGGTIDLLDLAPGAYFVWIRPQYPATSNLQVTLRSMLGGAVPSDGTPVSLATISPGQAAHFTFNAQAGESVGVALTNVVATPPNGTNHVVNFYVYPPGDGNSYLDAKPCPAPRCILSFRNLAKSGTYRIKVLPYVATATLTGTLTVSKAVTGTLTPEQTIDANLDVPGRPAYLSFTATTGQHFSLNVGGLNPSPATADAVTATVYDSRGNNKGNVSTSTGASLELPNLAADTYFVWITQSLPFTSAMQVTLRSSPLIATDGTGVNFDTRVIGQASYYTFNAQAGESVGVALTNVVATPPNGTNHAVNFYVYPPGDGNSYLDAKPCPAPRCMLSFRNLAKSGTYRVKILPYVATATLTGTLTVSKAVTGTLTPEQTIDANLDVPGRPAYLSFTATTGQHFSLNVGGLNPSPATADAVSATVYDSRGNNKGNVSTSTGASLELPNLAADTYFVWITQSLPFTSAMQVTLRASPLIAADGTGVNFNTKVIGQASYYTFNAQAGESVAVALTNLVATPPNGTNHVVNLYVYPPGDGNSYLDAKPCPAPRCILSFRNLAKSGTYRVKMLPYVATATLTGTLTVSKAVTGTLTPEQTIDANLDVPGRSAYLSFTATAGQHYSLNVGGLNPSPATADAVSATVYDSLGNSKGTVSTSTGASLELPNLAADTYFVWIRQSWPFTSAMQVTLRSSPLIAADGTGVNFDTKVIGQAAYYTFNAQAGETVGVALTNLVATPLNGTGNVVNFYVYPPGDGTSYLDSKSCAAPRCMLSFRNLAKSGTYRVKMLPYVATATLTGTLSVSKAITGTLTAGQPFALSLGAPGQPAVLSFSRAAAQSLSMTIGPISATPAGTSYTARLYNAAGSEVTSASTSSSSPSMTLTVASLPAGSYTVWISPAVPATASMTVSF